MRSALVVKHRRELGRGGNGERERAVTLQRNKNLREVSRAIEPQAYRDHVVGDSGCEATLAETNRACREVEEVGGVDVVHDEIVGVSRSKADGGVLDILGGAWDLDGEGLGGACIASGIESGVI